jgi:hypothetical protein
MPSGGASGRVDLYALCTFSSYMQKERCIEIVISGASISLRIGAASPLSQLRYLSAIDGYDRCIEIAISGASTSPASGAASPPSHVGYLWCIRLL